MTSFRTLLEEGAQRLQAGDSARIDAEVLLGFACGCRREYMYTWPDRCPAPNQVDHYRELLARRARGEPVAYLTGQRAFWSLQLCISPAVLIPRQDTELLVEKVLEQHGQEAMSVADLGTGSGAIALALASERPQWRIVATDRSREALVCASSNRDRLQLGNVSFRQGHWCAVLEPDCYHVLVSNPPYIAPDDLHLQQGDLRHEPRAALVAEDEGLADIRQIVTQSMPVLKAGGMLYLEHGYQQGRAVRDILAVAGFEQVQSWRDLGGRERVSAGRKPLADQYREQDAGHE